MDGSVRDTVVVGDVVAECVPGEGQIALAHEINAQTT